MIHNIDNNSFKYFTDSFQSVESYYNNHELNQSILCKIDNILNTGKYIPSKKRESLIKQRDYLKEQLPDSAVLTLAQGFQDRVECYQKN